MSAFVKICPKCGHHNPEYENACAQCACFIGMETPVSAPSTLSEPGRRGSAPVQHPSAADSGVTSASAPQPAPGQVPSTLYLQVLGSRQIFEVHDGWTVGQSHATSSAELQLRDLPGIQYVHRDHCRFSCLDGAWQVTATDQRQFGRDFTNPTTINQTRLAPGAAQGLKNGDQLSLAQLKLVVRII